MTKVTQPRPRFHTPGSEFKSRSRRDNRPEFNKKVKERRRIKKLQEKPAKKKNRK